MRESLGPRSGSLWRRSSASHPEECVEVAILGAEVRTRDSKTPEGRVLVFSGAAWREFHTVLRNDKLRNGVLRNGPEQPSAS